MIKYKVVFATLLGVIATGQLMCMEGSNGRLNFLVNGERKIEQYSEEDMSYFTPPTEFVGKCILDVIPLGQSDRKNLTDGFDRATEEEITVAVSYVLHKKKFWTKITPLFKVSKKEPSFFVEVTEGE